MNIIWTSTSGNPCPSCYALNGQVHTQSDWEQFGVTPGDHALYCQEHCSCTMSETDADEQGDLKAVPLRSDTASQTKGASMKSKPMPVLFSAPIVEKLDLPARAEILPMIESGQLEHIDFKARVYRADKENLNHYKFQDVDLPNFAASFEGNPFLRNHDTYDIGARDGTILEASLDGAYFRQTIRLTTRRGMTDFVEGRIDRFSIGWNYSDVLCTICNSSWMNCWSHVPGKTYMTDKGERVCELLFVNPTGKETSAVNTPASQDTGVEGLRQLQEYKLEVHGKPAVTHAKTASIPTLLKGVRNMKNVKRNGSVLAVEESDILPTDELIAETETEARLEENRRASAALLGEAERLRQLESALEQSNKVLVAQCEHLLTTGLATSRLPELTQARIRKQFAGRAFEATELHTAIKDAQTEIAALQSVTGPSRSGIAGIVESRDQFRLAVEDLFGMPRDPKEANIKTYRLSGIREAYVQATGDRDFMGGYYPEFSLVTANFPGIVANVMNKMLLQAWKDFEQHYGWWKKITTVEHFTNLNDVSWIRTGTIASLPTVPERGEYPELNLGDNKETSTWEKFGGYVPLTIEAVLRDDIRAFKRMPREAALAGIRNISEQIAEIFTSNSAAGPTLADGGALFNATAVTTAGGHANLLTTALGTNYDAWNTVAAAVYNQPLLVKNASGVYGTGKKQAIDPSIILVPRSLKNQAEALFVPRWEAQAQNVSAVSPSWGGRVEVLTVPEWTDATDWAAVVDPSLVPGVMLGEIFGVEPQIFSASSEIDPAMFANDESRIKVRQFLTVGVADFRPLHKSNVA